MPAQARLGRRPEPRKAAVIRAEEAIQETRRRWLNITRPSPCRQWWSNFVGPFGRKTRRRTGGWAQTDHPNPKATIALRIAVCQAIPGVARNGSTNTLTRPFLGCESAEEHSESNGSMRQRRFV